MKKRVSWTTTRDMVPKGGGGAGGGLAGEGWFGTPWSAADGV